MASFSLAKLLYKWEVTIFNKKKRILLVEVEGPSEAPRFVSVYHSLPETANMPCAKWFAVC